MGGSLFISSAAGVSPGLWWEQLDPEGPALPTNRVSLCKTVRLSCPGVTSSALSTKTAHGVLCLSVVPPPCASHPGWPVKLLCVSAGVEHRQLLDLAQKHFSSLSQAYTEDAVPTLAPCRFTGSEVGTWWGSQPGPLGDLAFHYCRDALSRTGVP